MLSGLDTCIHCGFCLPSCPTYQLWGREADSPRGRIHLMGLLASGEARPRDVVTYLDNCLGCLACTDACPSGVPYGALIEEARAVVEERHRRPPGERLLRALVFAVFPHRRRLRAAATAGLVARRLGLLALLRRVGLLDRVPMVASLDNLLPDITFRQLWGRSAPAAGPPPPAPSGGPKVGLLVGCVQGVLFPHVNAAAERVLAAEGCVVTVPEGQGCCGALMLHTGRSEAALSSARALVDAFEASGELDFVAVTSAGCGSAMKDYGRLLAHDPGYASRAETFSAKVRDVSELVDGLEPRAKRHGIAARVAYHDACHLSHAQGIRLAPRRLLAAIPGLDLVEVPDGSACCGSAGVYNLTRPLVAGELGLAKAEAIRSTGASVIAAANPGCILQLQHYLAKTVSVVHPIELLDASIRGVEAQGRSR